MAKIQNPKSQVFHQVLHILRAFRKDAGLYTRQLGYDSSHRPTCKVDNLSAQTYTTEKSILSCSDSREDSVRIYKQYSLSGSSEGICSG